MSLRIASRRRDGGRAARARRRERPDLPRAQGARQGRSPSPRARIKTLHRLPARRAAATSARSRRPSTRPRAGDTIRVRNGVYQRGREDQRPQEALPEADRQPGAAREGRARGAREEAERHLRQRRRRGHASTASRRATTSANGFFVTNLNGYTLNHLIARADRRLRPLRVQHHRRPDDQLRGATTSTTARFYIGQTPPQDKPMQTIVRNVDGWGSPIGFSAHEHALRDDHQEPLLQQRARASSRTRWTRRSSRRPRTTSSSTTTSSGTTSTSTQGKPPFKVRKDGDRRARAGRHRHPAARRPRQPGREQPHLRQLPRPASPRSTASCSRRTRQAHLARPQHGPQTTVRARRHRPQRPRHRLRRQRQRQLLLARRRRRRRSRPTARRSPRAAAQNAFSQAARDTMLGGPARARSTGWVKHPHPRQAGLHAAGGRSTVRTRPVLIAVLAGVALVCAAPAQAGTPKPKTVRIGDNYFLPRTPDGRSGHDRHVAVAGLRRGRRRARRQAQVRPQGREEVPLRGRRRPTTRSSAS